MFNQEDNRFYLGDAQSPTAFIVFEPVAADDGKSRWQGV